MINATEDLNDGRDYSADQTLPVSQAKALTSSPITRRHTRLCPMPLTPTMI